MRRAALFCLMLIGCVDTGIERTTVGLSARGTAASASFIGRFDVPITLTRAEVVFGPLYLCGGTVAGELCDEALAQWSDAALIDALSDAEVSLGRMDALTRRARSYMYDLGIVSRLIAPADPLVTEAAASLSGASVALAGQARPAGKVIPFSASLPVAQVGDEVEPGVPVVRSTVDDAIDHEILPGGRSRLTVQFDPSTWLAQADFNALAQEATCASGSGPVCQGNMEQTCGTDGSVTASRDCAALGQVCLHRIGCTAEVVFTDSDQLGRSLILGLTAGQRPTITFSQDP